MRPFLTLLTATCLGSIAIGFVAHRIVDGSGDHSTTAPTIPERPDRPLTSKASLKRTHSRANSVKLPQLPAPPSDSIEDLLASNPWESYGKLSLWLIHASAEEIESYWHAFHATPKKKQHRHLIDLLFMQWTLKDPQGALNATAGTNHEEFAWWAWSAHDPQQALKLARELDSKFLGYVSWGLGEFHPDWMRAHYHELPEKLRKNAVDGMLKSAESEDPMSTLLFLQEINRPIPSSMIRDLIRKDPWQAYDWLQQQGFSTTSRWGQQDDQTDLMLSTLANHHPDVLAELARQAPSGPLKRQMESRMFQKLAETNPEKAIEQARQSESSRLKADRLSQVAREIVSFDPNHAYDLYEEIIQTGANPIVRTTRSITPGGGSSSSTYDQKNLALSVQLMRSDPDRMLRLYESDTSNRLLNRTAGAWAPQDLDGFNGWIQTQRDTDQWEHLTRISLDRMNDHGRFDEAAEQALSLEQPDILNSSIRGWAQVNPPAAQAWLDTAELDDQLRARLQETIEDYP